jgi:hypothetical protein
MGSQKSYLQWNSMMTVVRRRSCSFQVIGVSFFGAVTATGTGTGTVILTSSAAVSFLLALLGRARLDIGSPSSFPSRSSCGHSTRGSLLASLSSLLGLATSSGLGGSDDFFALSPSYEIA